MLRRHFVVGAVAILALVGVTQAAPLGLLLQDAPDVMSSFISVNYVAATDTLTASGFALTLDDDGSVPPENIAGGSFDVSAAIDGAGNPLGGTLTIGGTVASLGFNSGTLLTGSLTGFGFPAVGDPLELLFSVTGGDAAGLFGGIGPTVGVILTGSGFSGSFASDFSGPVFGGVADTAPLVPLPSALLTGAMLLGCMVIGGTARRLRRGRL